MRLFGYPYNDLVICKDSPDYLYKLEQITLLAKLLSTELPHIIHILVYIVTYVGENRTLDLFCQMISVWP